jgi:hypothetical protein
MRCEMNVAVIEPTSTLAAAREAIEGEFEGNSHQSEWIDPEGNDWLSSIYWELTHDSAPEAACAVPELEHWWFG